MYSCPACGSTFSSLAPGSGYRTVNSDNDGDTEMRCAGCRRWAAIDWYVWQPDPEQTQDDEEAYHGHGTAGDPEPRKDWRWL